MSVNQTQGENIWNRKSFEHALRIGLGRVILYLQDHDDTPYRDIILHACLHNTAYDMSGLGNKAYYIKDIIDLSSDPEFYRQQILDKASTIKDTNSWDDLHLMEMVTTLAVDGDDKARQLVYDMFNNCIDSGDHHACKGMIVVIDGLEGLLYVVDRLAELKQPDREYQISSYLLDLLRATTERADIDDILSEQRKHNRNLDAFIRADDAWKKRFEESRQWRDVQDLSYEDVKAALEQWERIDLREWGRIADAENLEEAARDFVSLRDINKQRRYSQIFQRRSFPLDPQIFIDIIRKSNRPTEYAWMFTVLAKVQHPKVRTFALKLIEEEWEIGRAIGLLESNFEPGDWAIIEKIAQQDLPADDYYWLQCSVTDVFEHNPSPDAIPTLLNVYENGPDIEYRGCIVKQLHSIGGLSLAIAEECKWDDNPYVRYWARNGFVDLEG